MVEVMSNATRSQQQLFSEVAEELERATNESLILAESYEELVERVRDEGDAIQTRLTRVEEEVGRSSERQLSGYYAISNVTAMLAQTQGTCAAVAARVNTSNEMVSHRFQEQRQVVRENARLLEALRETLRTSAERTLQQQNDIVNNITNQLMTVQHMLPTTCKYIA